MFDFDISIESAGLAPLHSADLTWLQINLGKLCNQACHHCHVDAGPKRTERMSAETADRIIALMEATPRLELVDLTGGAPEMNLNFRRLVRAARGLGARVIDRCNLTVLFEPGQEDLVEFLVEQRVEVVASMPCYSEANVDKQRGNGVFAKSIDGIRKLNDAGYGRGTGLKLDLVYNPGGPFLPPPAKKLEGDYKRRLYDDFGLHFDELVTITNMAIARFERDLRRSGQLESYNQLLLENFNPATVAGLMCRSLVSISWDGKLFDCDFNQMLEMPLQDGRRLEDLTSFSELTGRAIVTAPHCFGCTAGAGSSCAGALD